MLVDVASSRTVEIVRVVSTHEDKHMLMMLESQLRAQRRKEGPGSCKRRWDVPAPDVPLDAITSPQPLHSQSASKSVVNSKDPEESQRGVQCVVSSWMHVGASSSLVSFAAFT